MFDWPTIATSLFLVHQHFRLSQLSSFAPESLHNSASSHSSSSRPHPMARRIRRELRRLLCVYLRGISRPCRVRFANKGAKACLSRQVWTYLAISKVRGSFRVEMDPAAVARGLRPRGATINRSNCQSLPQRPLGLVQRGGKTQTRNPPPPPPPLYDVLQVLLDSVFMVAVLPT